MGALELVFHTFEDVFVDNGNQHMVTRGVTVDKVKGRTIFIGDLHGMYDEAVELLRLIQPTPDDYVLWCGDYVDRGPDSALCCDLVREREQVQGRTAGILGNHEEKMIHYEEILARTGHLHNLPPTHVATRQQLKPEHYEWFKTLPLYVRVPEHNAVAVHAGVYPGRTIEEQKPGHLLHAQMIRPYDKWGKPTNDNKTCWPSRVPPGEDGWVFWTNVWDGPELVVFGHSVLDRPLITDKVVGIDGGAVFGRQLHAFVMPEGKVVSVQANTNFGRGRRGSQKRDIATYTIHGTVETYS